jgi:hypothetical protein
MSTTERTTGRATGRTTQRTTRRIIGAAAAVVLAAAGAVGGSVPAARAQSGYRVCVAFNSSTDADHVGTGLVVKVRKGAVKRCSDALDWMHEEYATVYPGSTAEQTRWLMTCEDFGRALVDQPVDVCTRRLAEGVVYRYESLYDLLHPQPFGALTEVHR